jgi:hypothetical protein
LIGSLMASSSFNHAQATKLLTLEEHWKYNVKWSWDSDLLRSVGRITPTIVIENQTSDRLEGYIGDINGTRLTMYDGDQVVMVRFLYDGGLTSDWIMAGKIYEGYFAIDIPEKYKDADTVRITIGGHHYVVDDGSLTRRQSWVFINSAWLYYNMSSTQTAVAAAEEQEEIKPVVAMPSPGSLIDMILSRNGMMLQLPVRSADPGK